MDNEMMKVILNEERLRVLHDLALLDEDHETLYDKMTMIASKIVGAPISIMSMVGNDYQFFKSSVGLGDLQSTPLSHSFCKHVVATNQPLIVTDARQDELVKDNGAVKDLDVIGYLGMPMTLTDGKRLGSFCVIDHNPRQWSPVEIELVREFTEIVTHEIDLKALAQRDPRYQAQLEAAHRDIEALVASMDVTLSQAAFLERLREARQKFDI